MNDWNADQYLKFDKQRTQPAIDLINRVELTDPKRVLDLGCGPGNSTAVLAKRYPKASILGIDNSENMVQSAKKNYPYIDFCLLNAATELSSLHGQYDLIFSNACIQWIPNHPKLLTQAMELLVAGGILAVQTPMNYEEPIHQIIGEIISNTTWRSKLDQRRIFYNLKPEEYFDLFTEISSDFELWMTTYYHTLNAHNDLLEWYRATGLKPYLDALSEEEKPILEQDILDRLLSAYPKQQNGNIIFRFPRFFFLAYK